jgi:hypothetical protein
MRGEEQPSGVANASTVWPIAPGMGCGAAAYAPCPLLVKWATLVGMKAILAALALFTMTTIAADGPVYHVVHFKFKKEATPEQIKKVETEFAALKTTIKEVATLEWGTDISPEKLSDGFTHCWVLTFKNTADRDAYLVHPEHKKFVGIVGPVLEKPLVVDFIPKK